MCGTFQRISQLWDDAHTLNLENCLFYLLSTITQFFDFVRCIVFDFIFYCVTAHTLYSGLFTLFAISNYSLLAIRVFQTPSGHQCWCLSGWATAWPCRITNLYKCGEKFLQINQGFRLRPEAERFIRSFSIPCAVL